ncbi:MAG: hypothetical protein ABSE08_12090 [Syntrophobacteraceae bacterium]
MIRRSCIAVLLMVSVLLFLGVASAQEERYPIMEKIAQKVIQKYQTSSCQELAMQKAHPPTGKKAVMEKRAIEILRDDPQMRAEFLNRVAPPIANKLLECGMIP